MRKITFAATQMACSPDKDHNIANAERLVRQAAADGANIILLQELFETPYFCQDEDQAFFALAEPISRNAALAHFAPIARELGVVLPISLYERAGQNYFNSLVVLDADGSEIGLYRKTHIPDGPGYSEKFYFSPGASASASAGTSGSRKPRALWRCWAPKLCSSPPPSAPNPPRPNGIPPATGSAPCKARPAPTSCRSSPPIASAPNPAATPA